MRKLPPIFFIFAAFFLVALAVGLAYNRMILSNAPRGVTHTVSLLGDHADPDSLIIGIGEAVEFKAADNIDHDIGQAEGTSSGVFHPGESYRLEFNQAGNFTYADRLHPSITTSVVVYDPKK
jgi:plastocyanin